jgi:tetratricopeptide (TPR) repeat protein
LRTNLIGEDDEMQPVSLRPHQVALGRKLQREFDKAARLYRKGDLATARLAYETVAGELPDHVETLNNLAVIDRREGDLGKALERLLQVTRRDAADAVYLRNLGQVLHDLRQYDRAASAYHIATRVAPTDALAWHALAVTLYHLERWDDAMAASLKAIELTPNNADAFQNLGLVLAALRQFDKSAELLGEAIRLDSTSFGAWYNLGNQLLVLNRFEDAATAFRGAIKLQPGRPEPHLNLAIALLTEGQLTPGWREFEWRWQGAQMRGHQRPATAHRWDGSTGPRRILLQTEQGLGDTLQFCRYAPLVAGRGHAVVLEVQPELRALVAHSLAAPGLSVVARAADYPGLAGLPEFDAVAPLMSLPRIFGTTLETIPAAPYLRAEPGPLAVWRERLAALPDGLRVGIVWAGNPLNNTNHVDTFRSLPLATLAPLLTVPCLTFISLQKGAAAAQLRAACQLPCFDADPLLADFSDTAALVAQLDLVICVDTAVAHLAGGMGKDVWLLSRFNGCWRWLAEGSGSPWYMAMRIFRQGSDRSWTPVIEAIRQALAEWTASRAAPTSSAA